MLCALGVAEDVKLADCDSEGVVDALAVADELPVAVTLAVGEGVGEQASFCACSWMPA